MSGFDVERGGAEEVVDGQAIRGRSCCGSAQHCELEWQPAHWHYRERMPRRVQEPAGA